MTVVMIVVEAAREDAVGITHQLSHVALGPGNLLHDITKADLKSIRLLFQELIPLLGTNTLGLQWEK